LERFRELRRLTDLLRPHLAGAADHVRGRLARTAVEVHANALLKRRDFAACLFPEARLRTFFRAATDF